MKALQEYFKATRLSEVAKAKYEQAQAVLDTAKENLIAEMRKQDIQAIKKNGVQVSIVTQVFPRVVDYREFLPWLDAMGEDGMAPRRVHNRTFPSWYRSQIEEHGDKFRAEAVEHGVSVFEKTVVQARKVGGKKS